MLDLTKEWFSREEEEEAIHPQANKHATTERNKSHMTSNANIFAVCENIESSCCC